MNSKNQEESTKIFDEYARKEFEKLDKENKGYIDVSTFFDFLFAVRGCKQLPPLKPQELEKIMMSLDPEKTGKISFEAWKGFLKKGKDASLKAQKNLVAKNNNCS